jgi:hypothetical protein
VDRTVTREEELESEREREPHAGAGAGQGWKVDPLPAWPVAQAKAPAPVEAPKPEPKVAKTQPPPVPAQAAPVDPREGETYVGHGIYMNGETIRGPGFAISLPAIRMGVVAAGLTSNEVDQLCLSHALQWGAEIENGTPPAKAVPGYIANFLKRSIMGDAGQAAVVQVRKQKAQEGYSRKPASVVDPSVVAETDAERMARMLKEMDAK